MTGSANKLSRLELVDVHEVWTSEGGDFTPWLAREENLALLGETIGLELELEAQEKNVGPFRADILCRDIATNNWVLIENQLERTDHTHLGPKQANSAVVWGWFSAAARGDSTSSRCLGQR